MRVAVRPRRVKLAASKESAGCAAGAVAIASAAIGTAQRKPEFRRALVIATPPPIVRPRQRSGALVPRQLGVAAALGPSKRGSGIGRFKRAVTAAAVLALRRIHCDRSGNAAAMGPHERSGRGHTQTATPTRSPRAAM